MSHFAETLLAFLLVSASCVSGWAGTFGVAPIRIDLDRNVRTGSITVSNDDEQNPLRAQVEASNWTQDADGKDRYEPTSELTFLPSIMTVPAREQQLVRIGLRMPAGAEEKAYRVFIEEIPQPRPLGSQQAEIGVNVRFGVPVFARPAQELPKADVESISIAHANLAIRVRNTGNVHFIVKSIVVSTQNAFKKEVSGWYLLPGAARTYTIALPAEVCAKAAAFDVDIKTDLADLSRRVDVEAASCK